MKRLLYILIAMCLVLLTGGCESQKSDAQITPLTEEELDFFNGNSFFSKEYPDNASVSINIRNQFLSSLYDEPSNIDLFQLFYCGSGIHETETDEEILAVMEEKEMGDSIEDTQCGCEKISCKNMDNVLKENMEISLSDTNKIGLDKFVYLPKYDAYYFFHGDSNYRLNIVFSHGEHQGNIIRLFYKDNFYCDGEKVLTLKEKDDSYVFVSNQRIDLK